MTQQQWFDAMLALLPLGAAIDRSVDSLLIQLLDAFADELARIDADAQQLLAETSPLTTNLLLPEWEADWGLPCNCDGADVAPLAERRAVLAGKVLGVGGQSRQLFIDYAARFGYAIGINEFTSASAPVGGYSGADLNFVWQIVAPGTEVREMRAGVGRAGERVRDWGIPRLECYMRQLVQAHRILLFDFEVV